MKRRLCGFLVSLPHYHGIFSLTFGHRNNPDPDCTLLPRLTHRPSSRDKAAISSKSVPSTCLSEHRAMSGTPAPLFSSPGSVYRRQPHSWQDEDEAAVDASIPSTPIDELHEFETPPQASSSLLPSAKPAVKEESAARSTGVKMESAEDDDDPPLRSVEEVEDIEQRARESDERLCRICFAGAEDEESQGRLISPCLCTGSMRVSAIPACRAIADRHHSMCMVGGV